MNVVPQIARRSGGWGWFLVWALLGSAAALGTVSLGPLLVSPAAAMATAVPCPTRSRGELSSGREVAATPGGVPAESCLT